MPRSGEWRNAMVPSPLTRPPSAAAAAEHECQREDASVVSCPPGCLRILIVEDEAALGLTVARVLTRDGHEAVAVESAEDALLALRRCDPRQVFDVVISDVGLPGMSGWQLASAVRTRYPDVAVVITSGWAAAPDDAATGLGISLDGFVPKPYSRADLRRVLAAVAARRDRLKVVR